jgi:tetratricopeptide (TPR) repeat protein
VSTIKFFGIVCFSAFLFSTDLTAQLALPPEITPADESPERGIADPYLGRVMGDPRSNPQLGGLKESPMGEAIRQSESGDATAVANWPDSSGNQPITGVVSLHDLQHPVAKKAIREAYEAQQLSRNNDIPRAIAKLESAIRIDPLYRDAHANLGVQYARSGRTADADVEFKKALEIGPPMASIYANEAVTSLLLHRSQDAEVFARKALELDRANSAAQRVLQSVLSH